MGTCAIAGLVAWEAQHTHTAGLPTFGTSVIAKSGRGCVPVNVDEHKRGGEGCRTRWEHGDKDVWKGNEGGGV